MRLNFQVLTYFLAIANEESITAACELLHVTQPTVSHQRYLLLEPIEIDRYNYFRLSEIIKGYPGIKVIPLEPELTAGTVVAWKKNIPMSAATAKFIEFMRN